MSESSAGLTQQVIELKINDDISRFLIPVGTILFYPDRLDNLYKFSILEHDLVRSKVRYLQWVQNTMNRCARNQFGRIRNSLNFCQQRKRCQKIYLPAETSWFNLQDCEVVRQ